MLKISLTPIIILFGLLLFAFLGITFINYFSKKSWWNELYSLIFLLTYAIILFILLVNGFYWMHHI
jgi:hypothetical protein